jgi:hypothetical protein
VLGDGLHDLIACDGPDGRKAGSYRGAAVDAGFDAAVARQMQELPAQVRRFFSVLARLVPQCHGRESAFKHRPSKTSRPGMDSKDAQLSEAGGCHALDGSGALRAIISLSEDGDIEGAAIWRAIMAPIEEL